MLRITADDEPRVLRFRLEGRLEGPWVEELRKCWQGLAARTDTPQLRVDLTGVTFVDAAGRSQLTAMHRQGAEFIADDCLMKAIVSEIVRSLPGDAVRRIADGERIESPGRVSEARRHGAPVKEGRNP